MATSRSKRYARRGNGVDPTVIGRVDHLEVEVTRVSTELEALAQNTAAGFERLSQEFSALRSDIRHGKPNWTSLGALLLTMLALGAGLVSGWVAATIRPLEKDVSYIAVQATRHEQASTVAHERLATDAHRELIMNLDPLRARVLELERKAQIRVSDADDRQDAELRALRDRVDREGILKKLAEALGKE